MVHHFSQTPRHLKQTIKRFRTLKVPLHLILTIPFMVQVISIAGLVGYFAYQSRSRDVEDLTRQIIASTGSRVVYRLNRYLGIAHLVNQANAVALETNILSLNNLNQLDQYFILQHRQRPEITGLMVALQDGTFHRVNRLDLAKSATRPNQFEFSDLSFEIEQSDPANLRQLNLYRINTQRQNRVLQDVIQTLDVRQNPWYRRAVTTGEAGWSQTSPAATSNHLILNAYRPIYSLPNGNPRQIRGAFAANLSLEYLNGTLREIMTNKSGKTLIMERNGLLIATSTGESLFQKDHPSSASNQSIQNNRRSVLASQDPITILAYQTLLQKFGNLHKIQSTQVLTIAHGQLTTLDLFDHSVHLKTHHPHLLQVIPYQDNHGLDWLIVTTMPQTDLVTIIRTNMSRAVLLLILILASTIGYGLWTSRRLARSLFRLSTIARNYSTGRLDQDPPKTHLIEVSIVAEALHQMVDQLRLADQAQQDYQQRLEQQVVEKTVALTAAQRMAKVGSWELDVATGRLTWSAEHFHILRLDPRYEVPSYPKVLELLSLPDRAPFQRAVEAAITMGIPYTIEHSLIRPDQSTCHIISRGEAVRNAQGDVVKLIGTITDITDRKNLEQALQVSENTLKSILNSAIAAITRMKIFEDQRWEIVHISDGCEVISGFTATELVTDQNLWLQRIYPGDWDAIAPLVFADAFAERSGTYEYRIFDKWDNLRWISQSNSSRWDESQSCWLLTAVSFDITSRKKVEEQLLRSENALLQAQRIAHIGNWVFEIQDQSLTGSQELFKMFGIQAESTPITYTHFLQRLHPEDHPRVQQRFEQMMADCQPCAIEYRVIQPDNTLHYHEVRAELEYDPQGTVVRLFGTVMDITERKLTELALVESDRRFRAIFNTMFEFIGLLDPKGMLLEANQTAMDFGGLNRQDIINRPFWEARWWTLSPETQEQLQAAIARAAAGEFVRYEVDVLGVGGRIITIDFSLKPIHDENGEVVLIIPEGRDISSHKQAEMNLKAAKEQLELVLQASSEGFWDWDLVTGEIYFSHQWKAMLGYDDHELDNSLDMWKSVIFEEDLHIALRLLNDYNNDYIDQFKVTQRFKHKNGSTVYVLSRALHLKDESGKVIRMVGSHLDMTQLVEIQTALQNSEMQLSSVLDSSLDGITAFRSIRNQDGKIIDFEWILVNPVAARIIGRSQDELLGHRLLEELPGHREEGLFDLYVQVVESGQPNQREFYYNYDGLDYWFENTSVKLGDGFVVTFRDITAIKQSKVMLQQVNQQLEERIADLNQRHQEMVLLSEISDFLQACFSLEEAYHAIPSLVEPLFTDCSGAIFILDGTPTTINAVSVWGNCLHSKTAFSVETCWALRRGKEHRVDVNRPKLFCQHISNFEDRVTTLCIPMIAQGQILGLFYLDTNKFEALSEAKQQLARTVAEQISMAIANLQLRETLQQQNSRDPLTDLYNRRYLEEALSQEIARAQHYHHNIGVIMLDVDHFKRFNDSYGHDAGDHVLKSVATLLKGLVRSSDVVCRYGGEEMTLLLPELSAEDSCLRAEEIRTAIAQMQLMYHGNTMGYLTASLGVAVFPIHGLTGSALIQAADAALYRAKAAGRNQIAIAPDPKP